MLHQPLGLTPAHGEEARQYLAALHGLLTPQLRDGTRHVPHTEHTGRRTGESRLPGDLCTIEFCVLCTRESRPWSKVEY